MIPKPQCGIVLMFKVCEKLGTWEKTVRETELRIVRNRETKKNLEIGSLAVRDDSLESCRGTRQVKISNFIQNPSRYATTCGPLVAVISTNGEETPVHAPCS
ncbi:hypothetical protein E3N88_45909 [Mikania micrantha]|uniref:Uncharacterized protein n=1 Tax=Mikania micrantha TaxID=192012 RepID=A0A5N6L7U9_9ASTR|nr:hypothetical protein E3N88_45909 [Mikania micrantha]